MKTLIAQVRATEIGDRYVEVWGIWIGCNVQGGDGYAQVRDVIIIIIIL